jgi:hypothetical protein
MSGTITRSPVEQLLSRLDGVRQTAPNQYIARCPAHDDKTPSLSIRDVDDRVLVNCFGGCAPSAVLDAVGLRLSDLFDKPMERGPIRKRDRWSERGLLVQLMPDVDVVLIAANQVFDDKPLSPTDYRRLYEAHERILKATELVA